MIMKLIALLANLALSRIANLILERGFTMDVIFRG